MKKLITLLLLTMFSVSIKAQSSYYDFIIGNYYYKITSENPKEVALVRNWDACILYQGDITVPDSVQHDGVYYKVTMIDEMVFYGAMINSLTLPKGIRSIGEECFADAEFNCPISLPDSLRLIKKSAFFGAHCTGKLFIPALCTTIEDGAFGVVYGLQQFTVDTANQVYSSYEGVLYNKDRTRLIQCPTEKQDVFYIPSGVETIGSCAFASSKVDSIIISSTVSHLEACAFSQCFRLRSIYIPSTVLHIDGGIFRGCVNLNNIVIDSLNPNYIVEDNIVYSINKDTLVSHHLASDRVEVSPTVKVIAQEAFTISNITSVVLPEGVEEIQDAAFRYTPYLYTVVLPQTLRKIGTSAFQQCNSLRIIEIPNSVVEMGDSVFLDCWNLLSVKMSDSIKIIPKKTFSYCYSLSTYIGGASVERIEDVAFLECMALQKEIVFPKTLRYIGYGAFYGCGFKEVEFTGVVDTISGENFDFLRILVLQNSTPPFTYNTKVANSIFKVSIPCGTKENYLADPNWSSFSYRERCDGVEENPQAAVKVTAGYRSVEVLNAEGYSVAIYDVMGRCIVNEPANGFTHRHYSVPAAGVYVVRVNDRGYKVVVR